MTAPLSPRSRLAIAAALFLLALACRWPLRGRVLEEYDSANYALAVMRFDLQEDRPHAPGYLFHTWAAQLAHRATGDPVAALTAVSALSGAAALAVLFELLAPALGAFAALTACLMTMFTAQVWLQHVRPMQEAFAALWLLLAAWALVAATRSGRAEAWYGAMAVVGLAAGAKQPLPLLMAGLVLWAARHAWRRGGPRRLAAGAAALAAASLTWFVPLSVHCGSPLTYLEWTLGRAGWHAEHEAVAAGHLSQLAATARSAFVTAAGPPLLALPLWGLAVAGGVLVARRPSARWLLWLLVPLLALRLLILGVWPRFDLYYLPFVVALAVAGLQRAAGARAWPVAAAALTWCGAQAAHVVPTLAALHRGPSPAESAVLAAKSRFPAAETLLLTEPGALGRHAHYYAERHGLRHENEGDVPPAALAATPHLLKLHPAALPHLGAGWGGGEPLGSWQLAVPRAEEMTPFRDFWNVGLFEIQGSYVSLRRWKTDARGRRFAGPDSAVVVLRAPPRGMLVHFTARPGGPVRFRVDQGRTVEWDGRGEAFELPVQAAESADGRVRVDVLPACGSGCFELLHVGVSVSEAERPVRPSGV